MLLSRVYEVLPPIEIVIGCSAFVLLLKFHSTQKFNEEHTITASTKGALQGKLDTKQQRFG